MSETSVDADGVPDREAMIAAFADAANQNAGRIAPIPVIAQPGLLDSGDEAAWVEQGYFVARGLVSSTDCAEIVAEAIALVRDIKTTGETVGSGATKDGRFVVGEANFADGSPPEHPEDHASKMFNLHRDGCFNRLARHPGINRYLSALIGPDVDCFNSQFIFKNPGAWGQPWHQDSLYFSFDREPQVGMWLATSEATVENGCLFVAPGSHTEQLLTHIPDRRPGANLGYLEVVDYDYSAAEAVLMQPGDVLFFHSFLLHKSNDNTGSTRRTALVYHYGEPDTRQPDRESGTIDWMPTWRANAPA